MNYGYFDQERREYVITRPDTPSPWINYLGTGGHSGIISNTAGGTSFYRDPQHCRLLRYRIHGVPPDRPGRYLYVRDRESGDYWSPSWQPVARDLDRYQCRHGLGYTVILGERAGVSVETTYFVPVDQDYEIWRAVVRNTSGRPRRLALFNYAEFCHFDALLDLKASWSIHCQRTEIEGGLVTFDPVVEKTGTPYVAFFGCSRKPDSWDLDRDAFLGAGRSEANPRAVEEGRGSQSSGLSVPGVANLCLNLDLADGEEQTVGYVLGVAADRRAARRIATRALRPAAIERDRLALARHWPQQLEAFTVETPDPEVNLTVNTWQQYQAQLTFHWSRFISYYERGMERGYGFRDTMQDTLGVMHVMPEQAREKISMLLSIQYRAGHARAVYYPFKRISAGGGRSDDQLWSPQAVGLYLKETGDYAYLQHRIPYADGGEGTVLEHLERGVRFSLRRVGRHGFPLFLHCDWNDSLAPINREGRVESAFVYFQVGVALRELAEIYRATGDRRKLRWAETTDRRWRRKASELWTGRWFARGFDDQGRLFGTPRNRSAKIFLNPQSWAVMSGYATPAQGEAASDSVQARLNSEYGVHLLAPGAPAFDPAHDGYFPMPAGARENGGIFCHSNTWAIIAEALLRHPERAFEYYQKLLPCRRNDQAEINGTEPYVYSQMIFGRDHPRYGQGQNSWLSGTASWMFIAVSHYLLGVRPTHEGLLLDPCLPAAWPEVRVSRRFRGARVEITLRRREQGDGRLAELRVDGRVVPGRLVPLTAFRPGRTVRIEGWF